jgi:lysophospholipase L1-like esterase
MREDTNEYPTIEDGLVYNSTIDELNELYLDLANEMEVHYLDINSYLKDGTGKLPYNSSSDGMHFDSATYQKILDYVCSHVAETGTETENETVTETEVSETETEE